MIDRNDKRRTLVAVAFILGLVAVIVMVIGAIISRSSIVSPVPQVDNGSPIQIIFLSPTPSVSPVPSVTP